MPLSVKDGIKAWIDDFKQSDAPQFKGKSADERREMAIAAYMSAKRGGKNEAYDNPPFEPDPPKKKPAKNSDDTATSPMSRARQLARQARDRNKMKDEGYVSHAQRKAVWANRADGGKGHPDKKNEAVEENVGAPQTAAHRRAQSGSRYSDLQKKVKLKGFGPDAAKGNMGNPSARAALKVKESVELDEAKYGFFGTDNPKIGDAVKHRNGASGKVKKIETQGDETWVHFKDKNGTMNSGRWKKSVTPTKESVELDEAHAYSKAANALRDYANKHGGMDKKDFHTAAKHLDNVGKAGIMQKGQHLAKMNAHFKGLDTDVRDRIHMTLKQHGVMEAVQVDELKKSTYAKYINKASAQAVGHSDEAGYQAAKHEYDGDPDREAAAAHLAGKADKRLAGIKRATKALSKEGTVQELKKSTLGNYVKVAAKDAAAKAYGAASAAKDNRADQAGKDFSKSMKRLRGIDTATKKLAKEDVEEAKSFDQKFKDHLKFATSKSPAVQAYMKKRKADRDAAHAKQDPAAVKKNYGPAVIPPGTAYNKASKRGMNPSQAANAVSTAFKNRAKGRKLPEGKIDEAAQFKVDIDGLPPTFIQGKSVAEILANLRKIVKQPSMIKNVERQTDMEVKKAYRNKAQGRDMDEATELDEAKYSWNDVNTALTKANYMRGNPAHIDRVAKHFDYKSGNDKKFSHADVKKNLSKAGIDAARHHDVMKHMKEANVNEISQDLKQRYADKAKSDYGHQQFSADIAREMGAKDSEKYYRRKQRNRMAGITKATKK